MFPEQFKKLHLLGPDGYDLMLSKLERNGPKHRYDAAYLFRTLGLDANVLKERYQNELRPYLGRPEREDLTLKLWTEMFLEEPKE